MCLKWHIKLDGLNWYLKNISFIAAEYTFFSSTHRIFSSIDHVLDHKASSGKFDITEITSNIFSEHNTVRLEIDYKKKNVKNTNMWRLNNMLHNHNLICNLIHKQSIDHWRNQRGHQKIPKETNENINMMVKNLWDTGTFLVVQWLRLHVYIVEGIGLIPGWETKILHATWHSQEMNK